MFKRILTFSLIIVIVLQIQVINASSPTVKIYMNGTLVRLNEDPIIINNRTMVPLRAVLEELGITVTWDERKRTVTCYSDEIRLIFEIDNPIATVNGLKRYLDSPAIIINNRTMIPLRFIAENFNLIVGWDGLKYAVYLTENVNSPVKDQPNNYEYKLSNGLKTTIVFLGDSTTANNFYTEGMPGHVTLASNWLNTLYDNKIKVINSGRGGDNIVMMSKRLYSDVIVHNPDLVVINAGLNDSNGTHKIPLSTYRTNYESVIKRILSETDAHIIIRTSNPYTIGSNNNTRMKPFNNAAIALAKKYNLSVFDLYSIMTSNIVNHHIAQDQVMYNPTHPNGHGHAFIFEKIKPYLVY